MADFAIVTLDSLVVSASIDPEWPKRAPLVARLAPETIEVIAPHDVKSISDLQGKPVSFGDPDSATAISARLLFSRLGDLGQRNLRTADGGAGGALRRQARARSSCSAARTRTRSAISATTADFISSPFPGRRRSSRFMRRRGSRPPTVRTSSRPNDSVETVAEPMALDCARRGRRLAARGRCSDGLRAPSSKAMTPSSATIATRIGVTSISRPIHRCRTRRGRDLPRRKDGSTNTRRQVTLRSTRFARRRNLRLTPAADLKPRIRIGFTTTSPAGAA